MDNSNPYSQQRQPKLYRGGRMTSAGFCRAMDALTFQGNTLDFQKYMAGKDVDEQIARVNTLKRQLMEARNASRAAA